MTGEGGGIKTFEPISRTDHNASTRTILVGRRVSRDARASGDACGVMHARLGRLPACYVGQILNSLTSSNRTLVPLCTQLFPELAALGEGWDSIAEITIPCFGVRGCMGSIQEGGELPLLQAL